MKKKLLIILLSVSLLFLASCNLNNKDTADKNGDKNIETNLGITEDELNDILKTFVYKVYTPSNQNDLDTGLEGLREIVTDSVYTRLSNSIGEYNSDIKQSIIDYYFNYAKSEDTHDKQEHAYVEFMWKHSEVTDRLAIEFGINDEGKIHKYTILDGGTLD